MENKNFFTGEHSTILINMDDVKYAISEGPHGGNLEVKFKDGEILVLKSGNADMFRQQWRECNKSGKSGI